MVSVPTFINKFISLLRSPESTSFYSLYSVYMYSWMLFPIFSWLQYPFAFVHGLFFPTILLSSSYLQNSRHFKGFLSLLPIYPFHHLLEVQNAIEMRAWKSLLFCFVWFVFNFFFGVSVFLLHLTSRVDHLHLDRFHASQSSVGLKNKKGWE